MPECNSLHIMRTVYLRRQGAGRRVTSGDPNVVTAVTGSTCPETLQATSQRNRAQNMSTIQTSEHYLPNTSLAMVASCMFEVPS
jgi:hypothetical protein